MVDLCDQRAASVDQNAPVFLGCSLDLGRGPMGREHQGCSGRHLAHVVDEDDALAAELVDHQSVMDDLVIAVDGGLEDTHHPRESLDRHFHARAKAAGLGKKDYFDVPGHRLA
jgi:hypothetical protein